MSGSALSESLQGTLKSLQQPNSVKPTLMCLTTLPKFGPMTRAFSHFTVSRWEENAVPNGICGRLLEIAYNINETRSFFFFKMAAESKESGYDLELCAEISSQLP